MNYFYYVKNYIIKVKLLLGHLIIWVLCHIQHHLNM